MAGWETRNLAAITSIKRINEKAVRSDPIAFALHTKKAPGELLAPGLSLKRGQPYMFSISTWPNPEHETCVAPSIKRAKSYVTRFCRIDFSIDLIMTSAASVQPRWRSIISADRISEPGFT